MKRQFQPPGHIGLNLVNSVNISAAGLRAVATCPAVAGDIISS